MKQALLAIVTTTFVALITAAAPAQSDEASTAAQHVASSIVRVELTLQYDKGQPPTSAGWGERCPGCGRYHVQSGPTYVEEERPLEAAGYLLSPTRVLTNDVFLQPRFIQKIEVRFGDEVVPGRIAAHADDQYAMIVELDLPLETAEPLSFDGSAEGPYFLVSSQQVNGEWLLHAAPLPVAAASTSESGMRFTPLSSRGIVVNAQGVPVGAAMNEELPSQGRWKGSPDDWKWISADQFAQLKSAAEAWADSGILLVTLGLRSPTSSGPSNPWMYDESEDDATERHTLGLLVESKTLLVLEGMKATTTARLEHITVHPPGGEPIEATFAYSLLDYDAFLATLDEPLSGPLHLAQPGESLLSLRNQLLLGAEVMLHGEHRIAYYNHTRIPRFELGWRRQVYPDVAGDVTHLFLFNKEGSLLALPLERRERAGEERQWRHGGQRLTPASHIAAVLAKLPQHIDENNIPLSEEEENRLAWLGVDLQELDEELARLYSVSELTDDGSHGALITYVYPDSPAASAGLEMGQILLRIHSSRHPRPINVEADPYATMAASFPWDRLDEVPEEYFEHIPKPWPSASSPFNKLLTDLGFGTPFTAEVFQDGEVQAHEFVVELGPAHFDAAKRFKSESLGLTVRELTYEVRRHFQKSEDDPGVIVSKIEPGSRASIGGLKPYEIITHVNDEPVTNIGEFEKALETQHEVRLGVQRMTRHRIVKIALDGPPEKQPTMTERDGGPAAEPGG